MRRRGQAWRASTGRGLGDRAPLSNFLLVSLTSNCAGRRRAVSVAWPQSQVRARGVRPMHARAVGVGAPDPERGSASTSSAIGGRRSEGLVRPSTGSQPPLRTRRAAHGPGSGGDIARTSHFTPFHHNNHKYFHAFDTNRKTPQTNLYQTSTISISRVTSKNNGKLLYIPIITLNPSQNIRWHEF